MQNVKKNSLLRAFPNIQGGDDKYKLTVITWVFMFLLMYIVAALVYWFIVLETQNDQMAALRTAELKKDAPGFMQQFAAIEEQHNRKKIQYIGEGSTFLALIILGGLFVYRATRKQIVLGHQQQNFMMAVTHELKTPVAIAQLNLETLQKRQLGEQQQQKLISNTLQETARLSALTNNILVTSQLETGTYRLNKQRVNLGKLAEEVVADFRHRFPKRLIELSAQEAVYTDGEGILLQMLLTNLLDNALKYSPQQLPVHIAVKEERGYAVLTVADGGEGIPDEEKKKVFQKFYRTGNESTRKAKGTGLGLYLCAKIVKDHRGRIAVTDNTPAGAVFTVLLKAL